MRNTKVEHEAIDLYDVKLTDEDVKKHIKFVLYKEIDIHLRLASELSFKLLEAADVDACQFLFSSGSIESGTINAFGVANA